MNDEVKEIVLGLLKTKVFCAKRKDCENCELYKVFCFQNFMQEETIPQKWFKGKFSDLCKQKEIADYLNNREVFELFEKEGEND